MNDALLVGCFQRLGNLHSDFQRFLDTKRANLHSLGQSLP